MTIRILPPIMENTVQFVSMTQQSLFAAARPVIPIPSIVDSGM